jgi:glutathione-regulated potassium-efflux system ancillary protein KefC/glutathione-regulated potassium-efflux system protein KefB
MDLLRTAGADKAKLLLVAIDDKDKAVQMVEAAHEAFPDLTILARAYDRRHAYELLKTPKVGVERETFESALNMGRKALMKLGLGERRASRAAALFREQDDKFFKQLAPVAGEEESYIMAARDARETTERLLRAEMQKIAEEEDETEAAVAKRQRRLEADKERV